MSNPQSLHNLFQEQQFGNPGLGISLGRAQAQGPPSRPQQSFAPFVPISGNIPVHLMPKMSAIPSVLPHAAFSASHHREHPKSSSQIDNIVTMRSSTGMQGLREAEEGSQFVKLTPAATKFCAAGVIAPQNVAPTVQTDIKPHLDPNSNVNSRSGSLAVLNRHPTLFTKDATIERKTAELNNVLGKASSGRLDSKAKILPSRDKKEEKFTVKRPKSAPSTPTVNLEQGKSNARIELDLHLDSGVCVEGGYLKGKILVQVRAHTKNQGHVHLGGGKARVIGFEAIVYNDQRNTFYHCSAPLENISPFCHLLYASTPDSEGFRRARDGNHELPFAMRLPPRPTNFPVAKGAYESKLNGSSIRYIAMVSIKMKDARTGKRSVAHFYRTVEIWPIFDPKMILAASPTPLYATIAKPLFLGGSGTLKLTASLHRAVWIAGQRCYVKIFIANDTEKRTVKALTLSLIRFETVFKPEIVTSTPSRQKSVENEDAGQTSTVKRVIARSVLEMGEKAAKKHATAKGWWTGVEPGAFYEFNHHILLPPFALTIPRSRLIEVGYILEIAVGTGPLASDVSVQLPVRIINYISIDPPPNCGPAERLRNLASTAMRSRGEIPSNEAMVSQSTYLHPNLHSNSHSVIPNVLGNDTLGGDSQPNTGTYNGNLHIHPLGRLEIRNPEPSAFISPATNATISVPGVWIEEKNDLQKAEESQHALEESNDGLVHVEVEPFGRSIGTNGPGHARREMFQHESSRPPSQSNQFVGDDVFDHASLNDYEEEGLDKIIQSVNPNQFEMGERLEFSELTDSQPIDAGLGLVEAMYRDDLMDQNGPEDPSISNGSNDPNSLGNDMILTPPPSDKSDFVKENASTQVPDLRTMRSSSDGSHDVTKIRRLGSTLPLQPVTVIETGRESVRPLPPEPLRSLEESNPSNGPTTSLLVADRGNNERPTRLNLQRPQPRPLLTSRVSKQTILTLERKRMSVERSSGRGTGSNMAALNFTRRTQEKTAVHAIPSTGRPDAQLLTAPSKDSKRNEGLQPSGSPKQQSAHQQQPSMVDVPSSVSALLRQPLKTPRTAGYSGQLPSFSPSEPSELNGNKEIPIKIPSHASATAFEPSNEPDLGKGTRGLAGKVPIVGGPMSIKSRIAMFEQGNNPGAVAPAFGGLDQTNHTFSSANEGARVFRRM